MKTLMISEAEAQSLMRKNRWSNVFVDQAEWVKNFAKLKQGIENKPKVLEFGELRMHGKSSTATDVVAECGAKVYLKITQFHDFEFQLADVGRVKIVMTSEKDSAELIVFESAFAEKTVLLMVDTAAGHVTFTDYLASQQFDFSRVVNTAELLSIAA